MMAAYFDKILIANRGEIACRVIKTAKSLSIKTVAVYSEADQNALHVRMADEAVLLGPAPPRDSYLKAEAIIEAALKTGAKAIHPGYGFLSENAGFAEKIAKAGLVFIGPPASAIVAMGGKSQSKVLMAKAGVPLIPGYHGDEQSEAFLKAEADKIGYPVLIKASAGGGGKGMRVVESAADFKAHYDGAKREAQSSFGDDKLLLEKYLARPRHVEIQVFSDGHGNHLYLFERDCSAQRRHQKVIEEAPAPHLSEATRKKMGEAAVAAAKAINYQGAGTVEFLLDENGIDFYFMEMNTRLQVEHPVTEMITKLDLVEWQLMVASGLPLPMTQADLSITGHALEARIYAEDPDHDFLPSPGMIDHLAYPKGDVRVDTGIAEGEGFDISPFYDPMIAKIIVYGETRRDAIAKMQKALSDLKIVGLKTNIGFLKRLIGHTAFKAGMVDTKMIDRFKADLTLDKKIIPDDVLCLMASAIISAWHDAQKQSPWHHLKAWRHVGRAAEEIILRLDDTQYKIGVRYEGERIEIILPSGVQKTYHAKAQGQNIAYLKGKKLIAFYDGTYFDADYLDPKAITGDAAEMGGRLTSPMPGKVVAVHVKMGDSVKKGQPLVIIEAMKMEHTITAPMEGEIADIHAAVGAQVTDGFELVSFKKAKA
jgi:3-methylcrotonyl-CoA carboxylase alpha subunit